MTDGHSTGYATIWWNAQLLFHGRFMVERAEEQSTQSRVMCQQKEVLDGSAGVDPPERHRPNLGSGSKTG
jgi:hypothetical protein